MSGLTVQETVEEALGPDPYYQSPSSSAPNRPRLWNPVSNVPQDNHPTLYEDISAQGQWSPSAAHSGNAGSYKGKGNATREDPIQQQPLGQRWVRGTDGLIEKLDKSYRVRNRDYKKIYDQVECSVLCIRIFQSSMNSENDPWQSTTKSENDQWRTITYEVAFGEKVHCKIRRFVVVVQQDNQSCICLPVTTYDGKGYLKPGINLTEHGLIYSDKGRRQSKAFIRSR